MSAAPRYAVNEIHRQRLLAGAAAACREIGAGRLTVSDVVAHARVSRRTFYDVFSDRDDCLMTALEEGLGRAAARVGSAYRRGLRSGWPQAMRAGVEALLAFLDEDRLYGCVLMIDALAAGMEALERRAQVVAVLAQAVDGGRRPAHDQPGVGAATAEAAVGAVLSILHARLVAEPQRSVSPLAGELTAVILLPYLGPAAASREARRPGPLREVGPLTADDPISEMETRLTYRTLRTLRAAAESPGASNRELAETAGVADQGQISRLLTRLAEAGLMENANNGDGRRGEPNAWRLTPKGAELEEAMRQQG